MSTFDPAHHLMVACAFGAPETDLRGAFQRATATPRALLEAATGNQLRPQLACYAQMLEGPEATRVRSELESQAAACRGKGLFAAAELKRVLQALGEAGIGAVTFKGPAFAEFFGGGPALREMTDLDVLVDERALRPAVGALRALGYRESIPEAALACASFTRAATELALWHDSGTLLELHWRFAPRWCPAAIRARDVLDRVAPRDFYGMRVLWPPIEELLLLHVCDGMKSGGSGIRWVGDMAAILRSAAVDWDRVVAIARRNEGLNSVRIALAIVEDLSDAASKALGLRLDNGLHGEGQALALEARHSSRLARAVEAVKNRLGSDRRISRPAQHFEWAFRTSDDRCKSLGAMARHLTGPSVADLEHLPCERVSPMSLRARALKRRVATYLGAP